MSHFAVLVLTDKLVSGPLVSDRPMVLEQILAPYDENLEVEERDEPCWCIDRLAEKDVFSRPGMTGDDIGRLRTSFRDVPENARMQDDLNAMEFGKKESTRAERRAASKALDAAWHAHAGSFFKAREDALAAHPLKGKADPECEDCGGTGTGKTTRNAKSKWDWWSIGGRWTGLLSGYDPAKDAANWQRCDLCAGTGTRPGSPAGTCNGCDQHRAAAAALGLDNGGIGWDLKWPTQWADHAGDVARLDHVLTLPDLAEKLPFAIITPDGEWHERGQMGWFATVSDEDEGWDARAEKLLRDQQGKGMVAIVVDCHI